MFACEVGRTDNKLFTDTLVTMVCRDDETSDSANCRAMRRAIMIAGAKADNEWMDRANARPVDGGLVRGPRASMGPGGEGFKIKHGGA